jgi:hypothetical protein
VPFQHLSPLSCSLFFLSLFSLACGVVGPPVPPTAKIPAPPQDLVVEQRGEQVMLRWTLPALHTDGTRAARGQRVEIYRWFTDSPANLSERFGTEAQIVYVVPEDVLGQFLQGDRVEFADPLGAWQLKEQAGRTAVYGVKALNQKDEAAGFSNLAAVRLYPAPAPVSEIGARVTERALLLHWKAPGETTSRTPLPALAGYRVFRKRQAEEEWKVVATPLTSEYTDTDFRFGETYQYRVRAVAQYGNDQVEGLDSTPLRVTPQDVFAPPVPENLVAIASRGRVDLTWDASTAADLAGYLVYRSAQPGGGYQRLTAEPILVQSLGDPAVEPGKTYYYVVTAVDRAGNESARSVPAAATVPAE